MTTKNKMRRSLLVSPYFPPVGVSGTKRALHLSRHLPLFNWSPVVLTGGAIGEPLDSSLLDCVPTECMVSRAYSGSLRAWFNKRKEQKKERGLQQKKRLSKPTQSSSFWQSFKPKNMQYWFPFDRYWLDHRAGYRAMKALVVQEKLELIHVSADPWAPLLVAERVARELKVPLIVDFRDPWSVHEGKMALRPKFTQAFIKRFEARLFKTASAIILNTETARDVYVEQYRNRVPASKFYAVRNAFDRGLFESTIQDQAQANQEQTGRQTSPFTALYFGRFRAFVSPEQLFKGFAKFVKDLDLSPQQACLEIVGGLNDEQIHFAKECHVYEHLTLSPSVPFRKSLPTLQAASTLVLVIEPECFMQIPGKLYDYFAAARPIIAISANVEANRMITEVGMGTAVAHQDLEAISTAFKQQYQSWLNRADGDEQVWEQLVETYSAESQAQNIAKIYQQVCQHHTEGSV